MLLLPSFGYASETIYKPANKSGVFDHFNIQAPEKIIVGESFEVKAEAYDADNNLLTGFLKPAKEFDVEVTGSAKLQTTHVHTKRLNESAHFHTATGSLSLKVTANKAETIILSIYEAGKAVPLISREITIHDQKAVTDMAEQISAATPASPSEKRPEAVKITEAAQITPEVVVPETAPAKKNDEELPLRVEDKTTAITENKKEEPAKPTVKEGLLAVPVPTKKETVAKDREAPEHPAIEEPQPPVTAPVTAPVVVSLTENGKMAETASAVSVLPVKQATEAAKELKVSEAIENPKTKEKNLEIKEATKEEPAKAQAPGEQIKTDVVAAPVEKESRETKILRTENVKEMVIPANRAEPVILVILPPTDSKSGKSFDIRIMTKASKEDSAIDNVLSSDKSSPVRITINSEQDSIITTAAEKAPETEKIAEAASPIAGKDLNSKSKGQKDAAKIRTPENMTPAAAATSFKKAELKIPETNKAEKFFTVSDISSIDSDDKTLLVIKGSSAIGTTKITTAITSKQGRKMLWLRLSPAVRKTDNILHLKSTHIGKVYVEEDIKARDTINLYAELKTGQPFFDVIKQKDALIVMISGKKF